MLQHHLLLQLHTYIQYMPTDNGLVLHKTDNQKKHLTSPSPRSSTVMSNYQITHTERTESESGASNISEAPELITNRNITLENVSFTSTEDDKQDYQEELLLDFPDEERSSIFKVSTNSTRE
uniref:Uncharacterized protein LOC114337542 n=1 Tax=Diabrotica virgifera virgifera TaxID=50390 RepID=A0A6P7G498_DIAVI